MDRKPNSVPDHTAVRTALWRARHAEIDASPHVIDDDIGLKLAAPEADWRERGDMHPQGTRGYRASIVGRARFLEDLVVERFTKGVRQYVILGAGLDSFAQRQVAVASQMRVFEIDEPRTQAWKRGRLVELGFGVPAYLKFVPVNFEAGESWLEKLFASGFDRQNPAVVSSTGVSMYLTKEANLATLREIAKLAPGTTLALTFILTMDLIEPADRPGHEMVYEKARAAGTPFLSFFRPDEILDLARQAGFRQVEHISRAEIIRRYFAGRSDGLVPASGEEILVATV